MDVILMKCVDCEHCEREFLIVDDVAVTPKQYNSGQFKH